jgi:Na+/melibiose symporter-like transporter
VFASNLLVSFGFLTVVLASGGETVRGFATAGALFGILAAVCILVCFRATRGIEQAEPLKTESIPRGLADLGRDRAFIVLFLGVMVCGGFGAIMTASTAYVAKYWLGDTGATRWLFTIQALSALASIPLWSMVARRWSKRATWIAGASISSVAMIAARLAEPTTPFGLVPFYAVTQMGYTAFIIVFFAMTADVCDWNQAHSGRRHEGVAFGAIAFANQLAAGLAGILVGALFGWIGIGAAAAQPVGEAAREGLLNVALLLPAAGFALTALIVAAYPVSRRAHAEALALIGARIV